MDGGGVCRGDVSVVAADPTCVEEENNNEEENGEEYNSKEKCSAFDF